MTLDIERERREFEAWYEADALPAESDWFKKDDGGDYFHAATYSAWSAWLAAKRAAVGSAEPVARLTVRLDGNANLSAISTWGVPAGVHNLYLASPAPVSAEPVRQTNPHFETFPKQVWLNVGDCNEEELAEFRSHHEITWSDSPIDEFDVDYVRADLVSPPPTDAKNSDLYKLP